jgi:enoyl-CoA hydratase
MPATVLYEAEAGVATLTLNRPDRLNTIVPDLIDDLKRGLGRAWEDDDVRAIRLRGAGRVFCAGYDISWGAEAMEGEEAQETWDPIADYQTMSRFVDAYMELWRSPKPGAAT